MSLGELVICPHPLGLVFPLGGKILFKRAIKEQKLKEGSSMRSGNEKDGNGEGWEKSSLS